MNRMLEGVETWDDFGQLKQIDEKFIKYVKKYLNGKNGLDIGCCYGRSSLRFAEYGLNVTGVDRDRDAVDKFNRFAAEKNLPARAYCESSMNYMLERKWDAIICEGMMHHLQRSGAEMLIEKIQSVTRAGGFNLITAFTTQGEAFREKNGNGLLEPGYLELFYKDPFWNVLESQEVPVQTRKEKNGVRLVQISSEVIARKISNHS